MQYKRILIQSLVILSSFIFISVHNINTHIAALTYRQESSFVIFNVHSHHTFPRKGKNLDHKHIQFFKRPFGAIQQRMTASCAIKM